MIRFSLKGYLVELAKKTAKDTRYFVVGNTSVDYDSFFSSVLFSYLLTNLTERFYIPIISCLKAQLKLRFQIMYVLQKLQIDMQIFHYSENLTKERMDQSIFNLVDHNSRQNLNNIEYITDHHAIKEIKARKHLIHTLGSNLTNLYFLFYPNKLQLVSQNHDYLQKFDKFIENQPFEKAKQLQHKDLMVQEIIRYGILMDAFNFDPIQASRWSTLDKKAVELIQQNKHYQIGYKQLDQVKFDEKMYRTLNLHQTLRKDFKRQTYNKEKKPINIDYSIIYLKPVQYIQFYKDQMEKSFTMKDQSADIYILMALFKGKDDIFQRQMLIRCKDIDENMKKKFIQIVINMGNTDQGNVKSWQWFKNPSGKLSRKLFDAQLSEKAPQL